MASVPQIQQAILSLFEQANLAAPYDLGGAAPFRLATYAYRPTGDVPPCPALILEWTGWTGPWPLPSAVQQIDLEFTYTLVVGPSNVPEQQANALAYALWLVQVGNSNRGLNVNGVRVSMSSPTDGRAQALPFGDNEYTCVTGVWRVRLFLPATSPIGAS